MSNNTQRKTAIDTGSALNYILGGSLIGAGAGGVSLILRDAADAERAKARQDAIDRNTISLVLPGEAPAAAAPRRPSKALQSQPPPAEGEPSDAEKLLALQEAEKTAAAAASELVAPALKAHSMRASFKVDGSNPRRVRRPAGGQFAGMKTASSWEDTALGVGAAGLSAGMVYKLLNSLYDAKVEAAAKAKLDAARTAFLSGGAPAAEVPPADEAAKVAESEVQVLDAHGHNRTHSPGMLDSSMAAVLLAGLGLTGLVSYGTKRMLDKQNPPVKLAPVDPPTRVIIKTPEELEAEQRAKTAAAGIAVMIDVVSGRPRILKEAAVITAMADSSVTCRDLLVAASSGQLGAYLYGQPKLASALADALFECCPTVPEIVEYGEETIAKVAEAGGAFDPNDVRTRNFLNFRHRLEADPGLAVDVGRIGLDQSPSFTRAAGDPWHRNLLNRGIRTALNSDTLMGFGPARYIAQRQVLKHLDTSPISPIYQGQQPYAQAPAAPAPAPAAGLREQLSAAYRARFPKAAELDPIMGGIDSSLTSDSSNEQHPGAPSGGAGDALMVQNPLDDRVILDAASPEARAYLEAHRDEMLQILSQMQAAQRLKPVAAT